MIDLRTHSYDVLVVGGGAAGLRAAIEAAARGARTGLVCKSLLGKAGTVMDARGLAAALEPAAPSEGWRGHFVDTYLGGGQLGDWRLIEVLARESAARVLELESWGALFDRAGDGRILQGRARVVQAGRSTGLEVLRALQHRALQAGVQVHMECSIQRVLTRAGEVGGALGYERGSGAPLHFACRAIVLATGSGLRTWRDPRAAADDTGDGAALALNAGAELIDMEFRGTGGIRIDATTAAASVRGLFAAGDAAGGVHGAAAIEGNELSAALVFGRRAGLHAAKHAAARERPAMDREALGMQLRETATPLRRTSGSSPYALCRRLQDCMSDLVGPVRRLDHLEVALERVQGIARQAKYVHVQGPRQYNPAWHLSHDLAAMLTFSESVILSSLERMRREPVPAPLHAGSPGGDASTAWSLVVRRTAGRLAVHRIQRPSPSEAIYQLIERRMECRRAESGSGSGVATQVAGSSATTR